MNDEAAAPRGSELKGELEEAQPEGSEPGRGEPGTSELELPRLPGFREMALRRMGEQRRGLVAELAGQRQAAGVSQTEIAARMGTSQSAVARLEAGEADVRASTLERYAAAVGTEISWQLGGRRPDGPQQGGSA